VLQQPFVVRLSCKDLWHDANPQEHAAKKYYYRLVNAVFILHKGGVTATGSIWREIVSHTLKPTNLAQQKHQSYVECDDLVGNMRELFYERSGILSPEGSLRLSVYFSISAEPRFNFW